jgi:hypothetical protein
MPHIRVGEPQKTIKSGLHTALSRMRHYEPYADIGIRFTPLAIVQDLTAIHVFRTTSLAVPITARKSLWQKWEQHI